MGSEKSQNQALLRDALPRASVLASAAQHSLCSQSETGTRVRQGPGAEAERGLSLPLRGSVLGWGGRGLREGHVKI